MSKPATLKAVKDFFEIKSASVFTKEWKALDEASQEQIKQGIGDGTLNY